MGHRFPIPVSEALAKFERAIAEGTTLAERRIRDEQELGEAFLAAQDWRARCLKLLTALWGPGCAAIGAWLACRNDGLGDHAASPPFATRVQAHRADLHAHANVLARLRDELATQRGTITRRSGFQARAVANAARSLFVAAEDYVAGRTEVTPEVLRGRLDECDARLRRLEAEARQDEPPGPST